MSETEPPPLPSPPQKSDKKNSVSKGCVVAIILGLLFGVTLLIGIYFVLKGLTYPFE